MEEIITIREAEVNRRKLHFHRIKLCPKEHLKVIVTIKEPTRELLKLIEVRASNLKDSSEWEDNFMGNPLIITIITIRDLHKRQKDISYQTIKCFPKVGLKMSALIQETISITLRKRQRSSNPRGN